MRFDCGDTVEERLKRIEQWHRWFAWRPVRVATHDCRWLEYVERRVASVEWYGLEVECVSQYRAIPAPPATETEVG